MTATIETLPTVLLFGALGAFVSLQRRLKSLSEEDLLLLRESITYTWLAPLAGAMLAGVLYLVFVGQVLTGPLFPEFNSDSDAVEKAVGLAKLFQIESASPVDYAKLLFWSFLAGFSESFVTDILGRFEKQDGKPGSQAKD